MSSALRHSSLLALAAILGPASLLTQTPSAELTGGLQPRTIGPASMSGRFVDLAVMESSPTVFYAASATGGLWKTTNNGSTWTLHFTNEGTHSIGAIALNQRDTSTIWLGSGERANRQSSSWGDGVYLSRDGGRTWRNTGLRESGHIGRIVLHPARPEVAYVAAMGQLWSANNERGLYRTDDFGATWRRLLYIDDNTGVVDVAMDPSDPNIVYAAAYQRRRTAFGFNGGGPGSALYKSTDGGTTWRKLTKGLPAGDYGRIGIGVFRGDPRIVYVSIEQGQRYTASTNYEQPEAGLYRSDDRGESFAQQSTWNPRPMYGSQVIIDPVDPCRIYMINFFSTSTDCGKTSRQLRQSLHGDDRFMWINPTNPSHLIKADDGGIGISYDRAVTWQFMAHLPVSQWYRVAVDMQKPYKVYGGLQDNGSWAGPSSVYRSEGITNADWVKWGGGDGFFNVVDTSDNRMLYSASQFLGLSRIDMRTGEERSIRPGDPTGAIAARRNWTTWGDPSVPPQRLGNAMAPANWDAPVIISHHDTKTIYTGTNILWKSNDRGDTWTALGDRTTGIDRRTLPIMGERPTARTRSLDDGVPYWPSVSAIAESPTKRGTLWVGTDDGNLQRSTDDGRTWTELAGGLSGLPRGSWLSGIEPSRHVDGRVYVVANNYRSGDFGNYVYRTDDNGRTWTRIDSGLPAKRVARTLREDLRNGDVLYLGTELGLFWSNDRGASWAELRGGMPLMAFNDLVVHPREHDLVLGTHSRGIFILDNARTLAELTPRVVASPIHVFSSRPAEQIRYRDALGHVGEIFFTGENAPAGGIVDFWSKSAGVARLAFKDASGSTVAEMQMNARAGVNRAVWNLSYSETGASVDRAPTGPFVMPGSYKVEVRVGANAAAAATSAVMATGSIDVRDDPRIVVGADVRRAWDTEMRSLATLRAESRALAGRAAAALRALANDAPAGRRATIAEFARQAGELASRAQRLYGDVNGAIGPLTGLQAEQKAYYVRMVGELTREMAAADVR